MIPYLKAQGIVLEDVYNAAFSKYRSLINEFGKQIPIDTSEKTRIKNATMFNKRVLINIVSSL